MEFSPVKTPKHLRASSCPQRLTHPIVSYWSNDVCRKGTDRDSQNAHHVTLRSQYISTWGEMTHRRAKWHCKMTIRSGIVEYGMFWLMGLWASQAKCPGLLLLKLANSIRNLGLQILWTFWHLSNLINSRQPTKMDGTHSEVSIRLS